MKPRKAFLRILCCAAFLPVLHAADGPATRTWTDAKGRQLEAAFVAIDMCSRHIGGAILFPALLPLLMVFYAFWARLPRLQAAMPARESRDVAGTHRMLAVVVDQHGLSRQHHDELVLALMPVPLRRPRTGLERDVAEPEIGDPAGGR